MGSDRHCLSCIDCQCNRTGDLRLTPFLWGNHYHKNWWVNQLRIELYPFGFDLSTQCLTFGVTDKVPILMLSFRFRVGALGLSFEFISCGICLRLLPILGDAGGADKLLEGLNKKGRVKNFFPGKE